MVSASPKIFPPTSSANSRTEALMGSLSSLKANLREPRTERVFDRSKRAVSVVPAYCVRCFLITVYAALGREQLTQDADPMIAKTGKTDNSTFPSSNPHKRRKSTCCNHLDK